MMAPRVDRTVISMPPRQVELAGPVPQGVEPETDRDLERTPNPLDRIRFGEFLSLFKGQGAAVRGDDRVVNVRHGEPPAAGD